MVILVSILCNGCGKDEEKRIFDVDDRRENVKLIETGEGKDVCIVSADGLVGRDIVPGKYLVLTLVAGESKDSEYGGSISRYSRYELHLYDLKTGELAEVIDVNQMMEQEKDYQLDTNACNTAEVEGKECIRLFLERIPNEDDSWKTDWKYLNININTWDTFIMTDEEEDEKVKKDSVIERETSIFEEWGGYSLTEANGFINEKGEKDGKKKFFYVGEYYGWQGITRVWLTTDYLPKENQALYSEFPQLKEYQGKEGMEVYIYLSDYPSAEEIFKLFMEEGQEVSFEGAVLDAELSIDGQEHEIHSFEEYYQWRK